MTIAILVVSCLSLAFQLALTVGLCLAARAFWKAYKQPIVPVAPTTPVAGHKPRIHLVEDQ